MKFFPTAHIDAKPGDFAETILMPGDPLRSQFIAQNFLEDPVLVNDVRGVHGYTGYYKGERVSVMASGMGMPSIGIYSYELFNVFGVENIIRVGTIGAVSRDVKVRDLVIGLGASTDSNYVRQYNLPGIYAPIADFRLVQTAVKICEERRLTYHVGNILSSDIFYNQDPDTMERWFRMNILGCEMEAAALYMNAAYLHKRALALMTVSNHILTGEETTAEERQSGFTDMMQVALDTAVAMQQKV